MSEEKKELSIVMKANKELNAQIADPAVVRALTATTFKGFRDETLIKQACLEAMMRGYSFQDILSKKIYAIPYGNGYSLVQSISDVRAIAMRSGQAGKSAPEYEMDGDKIVSCTVTVKRRINDFVGDYTATVYFDEYNKGKDNWATKPRTMIAKVAEMHALRMAFPEELSQAYVEEEFALENEQPKVSKLAERFEGAKMESKDMKMGNLIKHNTNENNENSAEDATSEGN